MGTRKDQTQVAKSQPQKEQPTGKVVPGLQQKPDRQDGGQEGIYHKNDKPEGESRDPQKPLRKPHRKMVAEVEKDYD